MLKLGKKAVDDWQKVLDTKEEDERKSENNNTLSDEMSIESQEKVDEKPFIYSNKFDFVEKKAITQRAETKNLVDRDLSTT